MLCRIHVGANHPLHYHIQVMTLVNPTSPAHSQAATILDHLHDFHVNRMALERVLRMNHES